MSERTRRGVGHSVRQRLLNISRQRGVDYGSMLTNYALERFLYRLGCSEHGDRFVLKGAMLFRLWSDEPHRATQDLDLLAFGNPAAAEILLLFQEICDAKTDDDGVDFHSHSLRIEDIRGEQEYGGLRVRLLASIAGARVPLKIDVGFGDALTPPAESTRYPVVLDFPAPVIRAYARETAIAEKLHAMVVLGIANSRMKDFYDIYSLAQNYQFDASTLCSAITATFGRRSTAIPATTPIALSDEFSQDTVKVGQWRAFIAGGTVRQASVTLVEVIDVIGAFLLPPMLAASRGQRFTGTWVPPGPWDQRPG